MLQVMIVNYRFMRYVMYPLKNEKKTHVITFHGASYELCLIFSSIAMREMRRRGLPLKSFSVGLSEDAPDLVAARHVADFLGTEHHEFLFTVEVYLNMKLLIWYNCQVVFVCRTVASFDMQNVAHSRLKPEIFHILSSP